MTDDEHLCSADEDRDGCEGTGWVDSCPYCGFGWVSRWHYHSCPYASTNETRYTCAACDGRGVIVRF